MLITECIIFCNVDDLYTKCTKIKTLIVIGNLEYNHMSL